VRGPQLRHWILVRAATTLRSLGSEIHCDESYERGEGQLTLLLRLLLYCVLSGVALAAVLCVVGGDLFVAVVVVAVVIVLLLLLLLL